MEVLKSKDLLDAIMKIEQERIPRDHMVVLAPVGTMAALRHREWEHSSLVSVLYYDGPLEPPKFGGVLIIEDVMHTEVVVRSLISEHRVALQVPSQADRICGMLEQCEEKTLGEQIKPHVQRALGTAPDCDFDDLCDADIDAHCEGGEEDQDG